MNEQAGLRIYRVREDRSCWRVVGDYETPLGLYLRKGEAVNRAWDEARQCRPSLATVELAHGTCEGEFRFGAAIMNAH